MAPDSKQLSQDRFAPRARAYVASATHARGRDLERLIQLAEPQADWRALDIATGGGHTALALAPLVTEVVASDLTPAMLQAAEEHISSQGATNVAYELADAESLPFDNASFDLVTCRIAAHHFPRVDAFAQEAARVLAPGGRFVLQDQVMPEDAFAADYVNSFERLRDPSHHRALPESEWRANLEQAGLSVSSAEQLVKRHSFAEWTTIQDCTPETIATLTDMLRRPPAIAGLWMMASNIGAHDCTFAIHHLLIAATKPL